MDDDWKSKKMYVTKHPFYKDSEGGDCMGPDELLNNVTKTM